MSNLRIRFYFKIFKFLSYFKNPLDWQIYLLFYLLYIIYNLLKITYFLFTYYHLIINFTISFNIGKLETIISIKKQINSIL
ncbi:LOW QUALITY PROTEIN: hypothetical protein T552_04178 [Pneumocystis carinii B80]|uniref:Uncharacterized protein n=1 Tax=Pneumocystis carinii (strain B80) TaxID=1408658 RepID=A0A0W4ZEF1_PNEC8|nr:LOW QUALITY PROTEIN: hypothetical protein T552_04178 [Pneumocystis carinii B80]KTW26756.1 LOW QUALITY PROTEIN: hypothetical protein T552_04178 [Pneumocystis carinii B80]